MRNRLIVLLAVVAGLFGNGVVSVPARAHARAAVLSAANAPSAHHTEAFRLIGLRSQGPIEALELRVSTDGVWGSWQRLETLSPEVSEPIWVGRADGWQVRGPGATETQVLVVRDSGDRIALPTRRPAAAAHGAAAPAVRSRSEWGARPPKVNPSYASTVKMAFIHHTVDSNNYAAGDVPAMLRAIQTYHMDANGWDDIAYHVLVDRSGRTWEGRAGGLERPVIGAHTAGFNTGSTSVAVLGNFSDQAPSSSATLAVAEWLAWKLPLSGVDPEGSASMTSGGNERYPAGSVVTFNAIAGHRDARPTACPGQVFYDRLDALREDTANRVGLALAYPGFDGGVWVASAQLDGDAAAEVITGADAGGGAHVRTFEPNGTARSGFFAFPEDNHAGVRVAAGNFGLLGSDDVIAASGSGALPEVRVFRENGTLVSSFMAYAPAFRGGVFVASGNLNGLPGDEIVTGPGPGGGPHVRIFDSSGNELGGFMAYDPRFPGGVRVAVGDVDGDGSADIVTAPGAGGGPHVRAFRASGQEIGGLMAYDPRFASGVYVGTVSQGSDAPALIVTGAGETGGPHVRVVTLGGSQRASFMAGFPTVGVRVAGGRLRAQDPADILMTGGPRSLPIVKLARSDGSVLTL